VGGTYRFQAACKCKSWGEAADPEQSPRHLGKVIDETEDQEGLGDRQAGLNYGKPAWKASELDECKGSDERQDV
jgi:hypothetical protein